MQELYAKTKQSWTRASLLKAPKKASILSKETIGKFLNRRSFFHDRHSEDSERHLSVTNPSLRIPTIENKETHSVNKSRGQIELSKAITNKKKKSKVKESKHSNMFHMNSSAMSSDADVFFTFHEELDDDELVEVENPARFSGNSAITERDGTKML